MSGIVRIKDLDTAEELTSGDYLAVDSAGEGLRKVPLKPITDDISDLKSAIEEIEPGMSGDAKIALLNCFQHVAWIDEHGQGYYDDLFDALYNEGSDYPQLVAVYEPGSHIVYTDDDLYTLREYLTVKQIENQQDPGSVVTDYRLSGTFKLGENTIIVQRRSAVTTIQVTARTALRQANNDFIVQNNTAGYQAGIGANIYLDTISSKDTTRRRIVINSGSVPFVYYQSGGTPSTSEYYPIPIPSGANCVNVSTETSGVDLGFQIVKLVNGEYESYLSDSTFYTPPVARYFDSSPDLYMYVYMRRTSSASTPFDPASEPTGIVIEFGVEDFYNIYEWNYPGNLFRNTGGVSSFDNDVNKPAVFPANSTRNSMLIKYNPSKNDPSGMDSIHKYGDSGADAGPSGYYLVPVPTGCNIVTFVCNPSSYYAGLVLWHYEGNNTWTNLGQAGWQQGSYTWDFSSLLTEGETDYYMSSNIKFNSSGTSGTHISGYSLTFGRSNE